MPGYILLPLLLISLSAFSQPNLKGKKGFDSLEYYRERNNPAKVQYFTIKELEQIRKKRKKDRNREAQLLQLSGDALRRLGKLTEAEKNLHQSLEIQQSVTGTNSSESASVHFSLGNLYNRLGNYPLSEFHYLKSLDLRKKNFGEEHIEVANSYYGLGNLYVILGNYAEAEHHLLKSLQISLKNSGETDWKLADTYNALGNLYMDWTKFQEAEKYFIKAIDLGKKKGLLHSNSAFPHLNLGNLYEKLGNFERAKTSLLKYLEITKKTMGETHPDVADAYNNLGAMYLEIGEIRMAEEFLRKSMEIKMANLGENHPEIASSHLNLGTLKFIQNEFNKSHFHYEKSLEILNQFLREFHPERADIYNNLAGSSWRLGDYKKAELYYVKSVDIFKKILGDQSLPVVHGNNRLGVLHLDWGKMEESERYFRQFVEAELELIDRVFHFLSEDEKEKFLDREKPYLDAFQSFCLERYNSNPAIAGSLWNQQLATKGILLNNSSKWRKAVKSTTDTVAHHLFDAWNESQQILNQLIQSNDSVQRAGLDSIQLKTERLEKELSVRSSEFSRLTDRNSVKWEQVQKVLKQGEAAVEIVRIRKYGLKQLIADSSDGVQKMIPVTGLTDTIWYAALVLKPGWKIPEIAFLKNGNELEIDFLREYKKSIRNFKADNKSFQRYWAKIAEKLGECRVVYFSPDGVFHKINPLTFQNPKSGKFLLDELEIRLITSTKDLVLPNPSSLETKRAVLIGNPRFSTTDSSILNRKKQIQSETWPQLPSSQLEIEKVGKILFSNGWKSKNYLGDSATENAITQTKRPEILHVATHGFFRSDSSQNLPVLHRSGLVFAKNRESIQTDDGILVSAEAMNMNLDGTKLVVLSACETGLGEIKNGEGVFGLQRAFKVAGAQSILMSLWKVSDEATQQLMVSFYKNWLSQTKIQKFNPKNRLIKKKKDESNLEKLRSSFLIAQKELKSRYPHPFHWGAFVLLGN